MKLNFRLPLIFSIVVIIIAIISYVIKGDKVLTFGSTRILLNQYTQNVRYDFNRGNYQAVINSLTKVLEIVPDSAETIYSRGFAYFYAGDIEKAIVDYSEAIEINPELPDIHGNRAKAFFMLGNIDFAIRD